MLTITKLKPSVYTVTLFLLVLGFIFFKLPFLSLPFYWDEAWVYGPAVRIMEESGPCLVPLCISDWWYTGHPLLFYFLASSWMKLFGATCFSGHLFAMTVSVLALFSLYYTSSKLFDKRVGLLSTVLLMTTPVFAAQSGIMVPETLLTLFSVWALYFVIQKKFWGYFIFAVLVLCVKESGAVIVCAASLYALMFNPRDGALKTRFLHALTMLSPILVGSIFYFLQNYLAGYFFYPRHLNWVDLSYDSIVLKFEMAYVFVTQDQGRKWISLFAIGALIVYLIRFKAGLFDKVTRSKLGLLIIFLFGFMSFCSLNYLSQRYMLTMLPFFFIFVSYFLVHGLSFNKWTEYLLITTLIGCNVFLLWKDTKHAFPHDISLAYKDMVEVHQDVVDYLVENKYQDKKIVTHGLVHAALKQPYAGYLTEKKANEFLAVNTLEPTDSDVLITSIVESDDARIQISNFKDLVLIKEFKQGNAWCKLWRIVH